MVIKVYTSGISGNKEVKKKQQRIMMILESKNIKYEPIDITEPGNEEEKQFMQEHADPKGLRNPLPPQIFNEADYCGDYEGFDLANENDNLEEFLKLPIPVRVNGEDKQPEPEPENMKHTNHVNHEIRHEDIINQLLPDTVTEQEIEIPAEVELVHGFVYTPSLAKRLLKIIRESLNRPRKEIIHGYCFTPALAQKFNKFMKKAISRECTPSPQPIKLLNEDEEDMGEEEDEIQESDSMKDTVDGAPSEIMVEGEE